MVLPHVFHITAAGAGGSCLVTKQAAERERMESESADYEKMERTRLEEENEEKENGCARELEERGNGRCFVAATGLIAVSQVLCSLIVGKQRNTPGPTKEWHLRSFHRHFSRSKCFLAFWLRLATNFYPFLFLSTRFRHRCRADGI